MTQPFLPLFLRNLRAWFGTKGFVMVAVAALVPLALTGAWVATHRADVEAVSVTWDKSFVREGDVVNFTAVVRNDGGVDVPSFNATLAVGTVFNSAAGPRFSQSAGNTTTIDGLAPGTSRELHLTWPAEAGVYYVVLDVDTPERGEDSDKIGEIDEYDNQIALPLAVAYPLGSDAERPAAPGNLTGPANATSLTDAAVGALTPVTTKAGDNATLTVGYRNDGPDRLENASVVLRLGRVFGGRFVASEQTSEEVTLDPGEAGTLTLAWPVQEGTWWQEAWINVTGNVSDPDASNNHVAATFTVDPFVGPDAVPPKPPEKLTVKEFYSNILSFLHLVVLVPLIALFYAAGVITDERERGSLPYLLTRPLHRWLIPVTKFVASYLVAAAALALGIVATYFLLFQANPQGADAGFLATPLLLTLVALFAYGALFTLLGVVVDRPYLVGLAFVLGWEVVAANFVPWVKFLTLKHWVGQTLVSFEPGNEHPGWALDKGLQWLPEGTEAQFALRVVLIVAVTSLIAAGVMMKKREFEV